MSQKEDILRCLNGGFKLTPLDALKLFGCMRLAARINDLRKDGHEIIANRRELPNGKTVCEYHLEKMA